MDWYTHMATTKPAPEDFLNPANWMTLKEFASLIKVNAQSIYNMIEDSANLPPIHRRAGGKRKDGRDRSTRILFYKPEVYEWMTNNLTRTVSPASQAPRPAEAHA